MFREWYTTLEPKQEKEFLLVFLNRITTAYRAVYDSEFADKELLLFNINSINHRILNRIWGLDHYDTCFDQAYLLEHLSAYFTQTPALKGYIGRAARDAFETLGITGS